MHQVEPVRQVPVDTQPDAPELLMKVTTLDLHPRSFRNGMVAGSVFGRIVKHGTPSTVVSSEIRPLPEPTSPWQLLHALS